MYNYREEELVNRVKKLRRFFDQKVRPMPKQSLVAMKVAFGIRAQYATIALLMTVLVTQIIGVVIFSGNASAVGTISYDSSITSRAIQINRSFEKDSDGNIYVADPNNQLIRKYDANGDMIIEWGGVGSADGQFGSGSPARIAIDASNNVYALDNANNRVQKFNSSGVFQAKFGSAGTADSQFDLEVANGCQGWCGGIDTDSSGNVYVADAGNFRVQKFNSSGAHQATWGSAGSSAGQFGIMRDIGVSPAGDIYVAGGPTGIDNRTQKFSSSGVYDTYLTGAFTNTPGGIDFDDVGNVYVADTSQDRLYKYNSSGTFVSSVQNSVTHQATNDVIWESGDNFYKVDNVGAFVTDRVIKKVDSSNTTLQMFNNVNTAVLSKPTGIAIGPDGSRYVASRANSAIQKYSSSGQFIKIWTNRTGVGSDSFDYPTALAVDKDGNVFVLDLSSYRVLKFDSNGAIITRWGSLGTGDGQFGNGLGKRPGGISVDAQGNVYVADAGNNRIQKFSNAGAFITKWGTFGAGDGQFSGPRGVAADEQGNIYVADTTNQRIQKFSNTGTFIAKWGSGGSGNGQFSDPYAVTTDASGRVYVAETTGTRVQKFDADGTYITKWGSPGSGNGQFNFADNDPYPSTGLAVDQNGKVYVADTVNNRVQIFDDASFDLRLTTETVEGTTPNEAYLRFNSSDLAGISSPNYSFEYGTTSSYGSTASLDFDEVGLLNSSTISPPSGWNGFFFEPWAGKRDSQGSYYVSKIANPNCQLIKFDASNTYQHALGSTCAGGSSTNLPLVPVPYVLDSSDNVYIGINSSNYVQKYDSDGNYLGFIDTGYVDPLSMAVDKQDNLYIAPKGAAKILKYDSDGSLVGQWGSVGGGNGQFSGGSSYNDGIQLQIDPNGRVYALNHTRIQYFSNAGDYLGQWTVSDAAPFYIDTAGTVYVGSSAFPYSAYTAYDLAGNTLASFDINPPDSFGTLLQVNYPEGTFDTISSASVETRRTLVRRAHGTASGLTCGTTYHYRAKAVANGDTVYGADQTFTTDACLDITTTTLLDGTVGSSYSDTVETNRENVTTTLDSGTLPPGLSLAADGAITGTPTTAGTYNFTIEATDNDNSEVDTQALQIVVGETPPDPFVITTTSLPDGTVATAYSQALVTDSSSPVSFSLQSGTLPTGLSMSSEGVISGTPTTAGTSSFVVLADNGASTDTQSLQITISAPGGGTVDPEPDPGVDPPPPSDEVPADELPDITDVTPTTTSTAKPTKTTSIASPQTVIAAQNNLFALAKRIPEPFAVGFPWLLLLLALILVGIQYYQVHTESVATKRLQASVANQERLVEEQNNFVALTTHYLHTPLTVMEGELSLMVKAGTLSQAQATKLKATLTSLNAEAEAVLAQEEQHELSN